MREIKHGAVMVKHSIKEKKELFCIFWQKSVF